MNLEQRIKALEDKYRSNRNFKELSLNDIAMAQIVNMSAGVQNKLRNEHQRHHIAMKQLERKEMSYYAAAIILSGSPGYLRCPQGWNSLESGFTTFQEIIMELKESMVDVALERMIVPFGMELWAIDDRGMMTLISANRDTSD